MAGATWPLSRRLVREAREARQRLWSRVACRACKHRARSRLRPDGMGCARLERTGDQVLSRTRRNTDARVDRVPIDARGDRETGECGRHGRRYRERTPAFAKATAGSSRSAGEEEEVSGAGNYKDRGLR